VWNLTPTVAGRADTKPEPGNSFHEGSACLGQPQAGITFIYSQKTNSFNAMRSDRIAIVCSPRSGVPTVDTLTAQHLTTQPC
jgi:hypothetical protein